VGEPARGYRWRDAEPGNLLALKHGARSDRMVEPLAAEHLAELVAGTAADALDVLNADAALSWATCRARRDLVARWLAEHDGDLDDDGTVRSAALYLARLETRAANLRGELRSAIEAAQAPRPAPRCSTRCAPLAARRWQARRSQERLRAVTAVTVHLTSIERLRGTQGRVTMATAEALEVLAALRLESGRRWADVAKPVQVEDAVAFLDVAGPRMHWWGRARGMDKTGGAAGLFTSLLVTEAPPRARLYAFAVDQQQAGLIVDAVGGYLSRTPELAGALRVESSRVLASNGATLEVMAADAASAFGLRPWAVFLDEFAAWPSTGGHRRLWAAIVSGLPKVAGSRLLIATNAGDPASWQHGVRVAALGSERWRVSEPAGPTPWVSADDLAEQRRLLTESQYQRLCLNVWTASEDRLTSPEAVRACVGHEGTLPPSPRWRYAMGLDVGLVNDRTVLTVGHAERRDAGSVVVVDRQDVWEGTRRRPVDLGDVEAVCLEASRLYGRARLIFDPFQAVHLTQRLRARGVSVAPFTFSSQSVGRIALTLYRLLRDRRLDLPDDPGLIEELATVALRETQPGAYRIDTTGDRHDDRVISLGLVAHALASASDAPSSLGGVARLRLPDAPVARTSPSTGQGALRVGRTKIPAHLSQFYRQPGEHR